MAVQLDLPPPPSAEQLEEKFARLREKWKTETLHLSSTSRRVLHPAYQAIIGMGHAAVPLILRELEREVDLWFWALAAITEEDPAPAGAQGDGKALAKVWLSWAKDKGYAW